MAAGLSLTGPHKDWPHILRQFEQTLTEALQMVDERQHALEVWIQSTRATSGDSGSWPQGLEDFYQRLQEMQRIANRAAAGVAESDTALAEGESALQQWLTASEAARTRLAAFLAKAGPAE